MRKIFSFFVAFLLSATSFAAVSYELNGGVTNDDNWLSKADMWTAFCADAGVTTLGTLEEVKAALGDPYVAICTPLGASQAQAILDNAKWDWLEAYIISVQNVDAGATALVEGTSSAGWRYAFAAFFLEGQRTTWPKSTDFAVAGTPKAFIPAWKHAFANPTDPTAEWVLNAPYKDGYDFAGWYTTANFSGNKVTKIDTFTTGKLYAKWDIRIQSDGLYYKIVDDFSHTLELIYHDAYSSSNYITTISIPKNITHNGITYLVTSIGNSAFANCSSLTSITIPNSVTSIGDYAFDGCSSLTSITIPNSVTSIEYCAFYNCSSLTSVIIPNSVTSIEYSAFRDCSSLTTITIPNSVTSIGDYAFDGCSSLTSITIPESVTSIGSCAFWDCTSLTSVTIGNSVTSIGYNAFRNCSSLTSVIIPNSVTSIGYCAFFNCSGLTSVTIPNSVTSIGSSAFMGCSSLTSPVYNAHCFAYMPTSYIGAYIIPQGIKQIAGGAFCNCSKLTSVTIPNSVTSIGESAFYYCSGLTSITCEAETPPTIGQYAFEGVSKSIPIYVPCGTVSAYNAAGGWSSFYNIQEPLAEYSIKVSVNETIMGIAKVDYNTFCNGAQISATPNIGYHFVQWSDGVTDNPRSFVLTQDTILTAEFAPNQYNITTTSSHAERGTTQGDTTVNYLEYTTISATANYGYHFTQWNDGNTDNPRTVQVTGDTTYTAQFDKNIYNISLQSNNGTIESVTHAAYLDNVTMMANAGYGYHFAQWSDGVTDNPRTFFITQDTTFTAEFAPNKYTITTVSSDIQRGTTKGDTTVNYLEYITISATASYGYHFTQWNDANVENPRQVQVTEDKTYTAYFNKNTYYITKNYDSNQGYVDGNSSGEYLDNITLTAEANYGYHFVQWSDGNTDNPRSLVLTQDTTLTAEFAQTFSGQCGDNLYWSYQNNTLTISGFGGMYDNRPWGLFINEIQHVVLPNAITHIGDDAFSDCTGLNEITIPYTVTSIGDYAFAGCRKLVQVNCYAINPPMAESTSFANYNVYLNVPCDNLQDYQLDMVFGSFKYIQCMEADSENVPTDDVVVTPGTNDVTITWPTEEGADTYTIVIRKDGQVVCTLTFNAEGQLLNIAFAPGRNGNHPAQYAEAVACGGFRFSVTGLEEGTDYTYDITATDESDNTLATHSGEFTTQRNVPTDLENIDSQSPEAKVQKFLRNGQLIILRDGVEYNAIGQEL